jgi:two-component system, LuxR family, response regulator FixJ
VIHSKAAKEVSPLPEEPESICVLDDDTSVLKAMRRLLCSAGLQMMAFNDARLFLEHAERRVISLAIIDIWMPEISGLEVQRRLHDVAPATPVIIMTGRDDQAMRSLVLQQGAVAYFAKPFEDEALLSAIRAALPASS